MHPKESFSTLVSGVASVPEVSSLRDRECSLLYLELESCVSLSSQGRNSPGF